jgi:hypothetical protein
VGSDLGYGLVFPNLSGCCDSNVSPARKETKSGIENELSDMQSVLFSALDGIADVPHIS